MTSELQADDLGLVPARFRWPRRDWQAWTRRMVAIYDAVPNELTRNMELECAEKGLRIYVARYGEDYGFPEEHPHAFQAFCPSTMVDDRIAEDLGYELWPGEEGITVLNPPYSWSHSEPLFDCLGQVLAIACLLDANEVTAASFEVGVA